MRSPFYRAQKYLSVSNVARVQSLSSTPRNPSALTFQDPWEFPRTIREKNQPSQPARVQFRAALQARSNQFAICLASTARMLCLMRTCIVCGAEIDSKRKDAKFCRKAACRAKDYRRRQEEAAKTPEHGHIHHASALLSCPCGRQFLLQLSMRDSSNLGGTPTLTPVASPGSTAEAHAVPTAPTHLPPPALNGTNGTVAIHPNSSEQFAPAPSASSLLPPSHIPPPAASHPAASPAPIKQVELRTCELYFVNQNAQVLSFCDAVREYRDSYRVRAHARATIGLSRTEGIGLGGTPGRWRSFYGTREPQEFDQERDLALIYWDDREHRAFIAEPPLLEAAFGKGWKEKIRKLCDERTLSNR